MEHVGKYQNVLRGEVKQQIHKQGPSHLTYLRTTKMKLKITPDWTALYSSYSLVVLCDNV